MRAANTLTKSLFTMRCLDDFVPDNHPLRSVRKMVNQALKNIELLLSGMYAGDIKGGRPSIAPEKLLRAMLLQIFYSIRWERTHESSTDADARLYCKADNASRVRFMGHTLCDNRHGLIANAMITRADGHAQCDATGEESQITLGAGKGYDAAEFIQALPHVVQSTSSRVG